MSSIRSIIDDVYKKLKSKKSKKRFPESAQEASRKVKERFKQVDSENRKRLGEAYRSSNSSEYKKIKDETLKHRTGRGDDPDLLEADLDYVINHNYRNKFRNIDPKRIVQRSLGNGVYDFPTWIENEKDLVKRGARRRLVEKASR
jgi:hypothetical protein